MRPEILHVIYNVQDLRILETMGSRDIFYTMNLLEFVEDEEVKARWIKEYNRLMKLH